MYSNVNDFLAQYALESKATNKLLAAATEAHYNTDPGPGIRSTGRLSWHISKAVSEIGSLLPITITKATADDKPATPAAAAALHAKSVEELLAAVSSTISNDMLNNEVNAWGMKMTVGSTLWMLIKHEIHHRGQLQVVMRSVGDMPVGVAGPTDEEMQQMMAASKN